jgi:hypothetical protein
MNDLIAVPQTNQWRKLKAPVLNGVSSPITRRVHNLSGSTSSSLGMAWERGECQHLEGLRHSLLWHSPG